MISDRSCDTEDWINDAENSALPSQEYITCYFNQTVLFMKIIREQNKSHALKLKRMNTGKLKYFSSRLFQSAKSILCAIDQIVFIT